MLVEREPGIHLGRDAAGDVLEDLAAEVDEEPIHRRRRVAARLFYRDVYEVAIARILGRGEEQRRIGGGVLRLPARHRLDVAGVGDHQRGLAQRF